MAPVFRLRRGERLGPALSRGAAGAGRRVRLFKFMRVRQPGVRFAKRRHGLINRAAKRKRIEGYVRVGTKRPADLFEGVGAAAWAEIGHGKESAVARPHADRVIRPSFGLSSQRQLKGPSLAPPRGSDSGDKERESARAHSRRAAASSASAALRQHLAACEGEGEKNKAQRRDRPRPQASRLGGKAPNAN